MIAEYGSSGITNAFPGPFVLVNTSTTIRFDLPKQQWVVLAIFDLLGREIETLVSEDLGAGRYALKWQATVASGVYLCREQTSDFMQTHRLLLLR